RRRRVSSASTWSRTAPTSRTSARSAPRASRTCRRWIFSRAATCSPTFPPFWVRSTSCSGRSTDERPPPRTTGNAAEGLFLQQGQPRLGEERGHEISGGPPAVGDYSGALARAGAIRRLAAGGRNPACRRISRHGAHPRARGCNVLYDVQPVAGRQIPRAAL